MASCPIGQFCNCLLARNDDGCVGIIVVGGAMLSGGQILDHWWMFEARRPIARIALALGIGMSTATALLVAGGGIGLPVVLKQK